MPIISVKDCGTCGDGIAMDTVVLQQAIDHAANIGGGTVLLPPGIYRSGTLNLRSNITLFLEAGAVLVAGTQKEDYEGTDDYCNFIGSGYFLRADKIENFAIAGRGTIDGSGESFWEDKPCNIVPNFGPVMKPKSYRPHALLYMTDCRNLSFTEVTFRNSPCFTIWLLGCGNVNISNITILNPRHGPNTDGIDLDCCHNVHISDCFISAGDDCIALWCDVKRLGRQQACENITVTNCTLHSIACGIRVGYTGDGTIRNCTFSNLAIRDTDIGISINSILPKVPPIPPEVPYYECTRIEEGLRIEGLHFAHIVMDNINRPFHFWLGVEYSGDFKGYLKNITVSHVTARANNMSYVGGMPNRPITGIRFNNIHLLIQGKMSDVARSDAPYHTGVWGSELVPLAIYLRHTRDIRFCMVEVEWEENAAGSWMNAMRIENSSEIDLDGLSVRQYELNSMIPAVQLTDVKSAFIHNCRAMPGTGVFLGISGDTTESITLIGNDLHEARQAVAGVISKNTKVFCTANHFSETNHADN